MSSMSDNTKAPGRRQVLGMVLLSMGLYAIVLGLTVPLALLSWPGAGSNDASLGLLLLAVLLLVGGSLLILVSLFCLKVHWLLVIGVLLVALLAPYVQGRLFPAGPASWAPNWFLTFGVVVLVLSFILLESRTRNMGISVANAACDWSECCHCVCCSVRVRTSCSSWLRVNQWAATSWQSGLSTCKCGCGNPGYTDYLLLAHEKRHGASLSD